jgi:pimeloyl-ACP methyl ester carboxylesterase
MIDKSRQGEMENSRERNDCVTEELFHQLRQFRRTHPYKYLNIAGVEWRYIRSGEGEEAILLLPGAPGICETSFQQILWLERTYCLLSVIYPSAVTTIAQMICGLQAILATENVDLVHVIGTSYGGAIAQHLLLHMPQKIGKLVLVCTGVPNRRTARKYRLYRNVLALFPTKWIHTLLLWRKSGFLDGLTVLRPFWSAYYEQMIPSLTKEDYLARIQVWIDFHLSSILLQEMPIQSYKRILIIEAENDIVFPLKEQQLLKVQYPQAHIYMFRQATHMLAVSNVERFLELITRFLQEKSIQQSFERNVNLS